MRNPPRHRLLYRLNIRTVVQQQLYEFLSVRRTGPVDRERQGRATDAVRRVDFSAVVDKGLSEGVALGLPCFFSRVHQRGCVLGSSRFKVNAEGFLAVAMEEK